MVVRKSSFKRLAVNSNPEVQPVVSTPKENRFAIYVAPFLVVILVPVLKFALLDTRPPGGWEYQFFIDNYARDIWIQLTVAAYIVGVGWLGSHQSATSNARWFIIWPPAVFGANVLIVLISRKVSDAPSEFFTVWLPALISAICLGWAIKKAQT